MRIIDQFARFVVAALFIFSGLVKLNDPIGTKIKMEEYFEVFSVDFGSFFELFVPFALPIAVILIIVEISLGVALLIHWRMKLSTWILLLLILFFTFLTFYSAYFNKVTDCGCFGDAIPLTPWESFTKDVILLVLVAHLFWYRKRFSPVLKPKTGNAIILGTAIGSLIVGIYAIEHLPYIDFRPYKIGNSIPEKMLPEEQPVIEYIFEKDGEEVASQEYLTEQEGYTYKNSRIINEDKIIPKIQDYQVVSPNGEDFTQYSFQGLKMIVVFQDLKTLRDNDLPDLAKLITELDGKIEVLHFTSMPETQFEVLRHEFQIMGDYFFVDGTVLKAMIRSNPGIILINDGFVLGKWHINDLPDTGELASLL